MSQTPEPWTLHLDGIPEQGIPAQHLGTYRKYSSAYAALAEHRQFHPEDTLKLHIKLNGQHDWTPQEITHD